MNRYFPSRFDTATWQNVTHGPDLWAAPACRRGVLREYGGKRGRIAAIARLVLVALAGFFLAGTTFAQSPDRNHDAAGQPAATAGAPPDLSLHVASHWGGAVHAAVIRDQIAYIGNGRMFRILDISDETRPVELGALELAGLERARETVGVRDIEIRGDYAFVAGSGSRYFNVVDISDPTAPSLVRSFARFGAIGGVQAGDVARHVELYGQYAYVVGSQGPYAEVFDIADPPSTAQVGGPIGSSCCHSASLLIHEEHLYLGFDAHGSVMVMVYDLSVDPVAPPQVGRFDSQALGTASAMLVSGMAAEGGYLYLAAYDFFGDFIGLRESALLTLAIDDPWLPTLTNVQTGFGMFDLGINWGRARLAVASGRLYVGEHLPPANARMNFGDPAFWGLSKGLHIFDIATDPASPRRIRTYKQHGEIVSALAATEDRVFVSDTAEGLVILDISDPQAPRRVGKYHSPAILRSLVADKNHLYVGDHDGGFTILDVSEPDSPQVVGNYLAKRHLDYGIENMGLAKEGDVIFLSTGHSGLLSVDVSDPARPNTLGALRIGSMPSFAGGPSSRFGGLAVRNSIAFAAYWRDDGSGLNLLTADVSDPAAPTPLAVVGLGSSLSFPTPATIALQGDRLSYAPHGGLFDVADPVAPALRHPGYPQSPDYEVSDVALAGSIRLVAVSTDSHAPKNDGLYIQDIADPAAPVTLHTIRTGDPIPGCGQFPGNVIGLDIPAGSGRAYVRAREAIVVLDLADPAAPACLGRLDGFAQGGSPGMWIAEISKANQYVDLLVDEPRLYVTSETLGLSLVEIGGLEPAGHGLFRHGFESTAP